MTSIVDWATPTRAVASYVLSVDVTSPASAPVARHRMSSAAAATSAFVRARSVATTRDPSAAISDWGRAGGETSRLIIGGGRGWGWGGGVGVGGGGGVASWPG